MEFWDWIHMQFVGEQAISNLAAVATIIASGATIITVVLTVHKYFSDKNNDMKQASNNLYLELKDTLCSLDGEKHPDDAYSVKLPDEKGDEK